MMKKAKKQTDGTVLTTLRSNAKYRILNEMIETARKHQSSKDYLILILDKSSLKVFSSCCKFFDLYKQNLYHIEKLEVKRKRFPKTDAIYFISPTQEAISHLIEDFKDDKEPSKLQYHGVHLCFTSHVSEDLMKQISQRKNLAPRILSFSEINLDFYLFNDNVFHFQKKHILPAFKIVDEHDKGVDLPAIQALLDELAHRLFTVCAIFVEFPYVQYQGESILAKALAKKLYDALKKFYSQSKNLKIREPRGTILILDRGFDLISPVIHDYYYQSIVYEFKDVGDEGEVTIGENKTALLNDQDELWTRFRNKHVAEVHAKLNEEVSHVASESKKKVGKNTEDMSLQDMAEVIRSMPKYEEMMKKYQVHMELINKGITEFTKNNLRKLIALEQDVISGVDIKGQKVNEITLNMQISQIGKNLKDMDYLRLIMIYFASYDMNKKDKDTMLKSIENESHRFILQNMEFLDQDLAESKKFKRRLEEMSTEEFNDYNRKLSQSSYDLQRTEPKICKLIKQVHSGTLDQKTYPYIDKPKTMKKAKEIKKKGAANFGSEFDHQDLMENPRIFTFVIGGLSHHEIVSIANLQEGLNAQIIPGSNEILNTKEYLHQLERLHKKETDQAFLKKAEKKGKEKEDIEEDDDDEDDTQADTYAINM